MDQKLLLKQVINFNKAAFDNTFNVVIMLQDQAEKLANNLLTQATWLPEEGKKAVNEWVGTFKKGRETFKGTVDESFKKVEDYFSI